MRQKHETATSFNQLKEITQAMRAHQTLKPTNENANISDLAHKQALKPKSSAQAKKGALKPTKRAFSERQKITNRGKPQESANKSPANQTSQQKGGSNEA
ncbi:hypothetical protein EPC71_08155 [Helicobacter pylori]|uniref:hypothetical protein n=1 Tax=Helicobacter pylori TaxID=210 RepID=UPI001238ED54|nr:hypothetical protein [Helicobacter pylori]KAA6502841.1 hypothetical protein EPC71_08155 [Helicobacter pylori]